MSGVSGDNQSYILLTRFIINYLFLQQENTILVVKLMEEKTRKITMKKEEGSNTENQRLSMESLPLLDTGMHTRPKAMMTRKNQVK